MAKDREKGPGPTGRKRSAADSSVYRHPDAGTPPPATPRTPPTQTPAQVPEREPVWARKPALGHKSGGAPPAKSAPRPAYRESAARPDFKATPRVWAEKSATHPEDGLPAVAEETPGALEFDRDAQRRREVRIFGRAACLAVAKDRVSAIRKIYYSRERSRELAPLLERLAAARVGFREVADEDLTRLASSQHHEGIVCDILRKEQAEFASLISQLAREPGASCLLALEGVGNPHNFGAILRSAVHFGIRAVLIPADSALTMAGAVYRVAEGAAERVPVIRYEALDGLRADGFKLVAAATAGECQLYRDSLPQRCLLMFGAEGPGLSAVALGSADMRLSIPGSGQVDSLNVAQAVAVTLGEWWRTSR